MTNEEVLAKRVEDALYTRGKELVRYLAYEIRLWENFGYPVEAIRELDMDEIMDTVGSRIKEDIPEEFAYLERILDGEPEENDGN